MFNSNYHNKNSFEKKCSITTKEEQELKNWLLTGNIDRFISYKKADEIINTRIKKLILKDPNKTMKLILKTMKIGVNKHTIIYSIACLTAGNKHCKKVFLDYFIHIVKTLDELYEFLYYIKTFRGFGSIIIKAVIAFILSKSQEELQRQVIKYPKNYGWCFKDVILTIRPKPRNDADNELFKYCIEKNKECIDDIDVIKCYEDIKENGPEMAFYIRKTGITNTRFPGSVKQTDEMWNEFLFNMTSKELIKNVDKFITRKCLDKSIRHSYFVNTLTRETNISPFFVATNLKKVEKSNLFNFFINLIFDYSKSGDHFINGKILNLIDSDLNYTEFDGVNGYGMALLFSSLLKSNRSDVVSKKFFKDKKTLINIDYNIMYLLIDKFSGLMNTYSTIYLPYLVEDDYDTIFIWNTNKKIEIKADLNLSDKKVIIINLVPVKEKPKFKSDNIFIINGFSYKTMNIIKLILNGEIK